MKTTRCTACEKDFPSRNQLFKHLKDSGHGAAVGGEQTQKVEEVEDDTTKQPHLSKGNDAYYEYYLRQKICSNEEEWKGAYHKLRTPLPITYRVHQSHPLAEFSAQLLSLMDKNNNGDGDSSGQLFKEWSFTDNANSTKHLPRMVITSNVHCSKSSSKRRKDNGESDGISPVLHALQELGTIFRQELVSAMPPLVLFDAAASGSKGGDSSSLVIADMCAAPGSKSLQLLDMLYTATNDSSSNGGAKNTTKIPSGLLVVNDSDRNRIVTLCQRSRHVLRAPLLAINMDARYFAGLRRRLCDHENWNLAGFKQKYDAVLCDAPCSGDGTTRKNRQVWNTWSIAHAMSLHRLQRMILRRALELLRPGGVVVYSTCSLNPLEDEAVVAAVIENVGGVEAMEIVPLPEWLANKCGALPGLTSWQVPHPKFGKNGENLIMYQSFDDVPIEHQGGKGEKGKKGNKKKGQVFQSMFPPTEQSALTNQLRNCGRFVPNDGLDSGGFFVACIKRLKAGELKLEAKDQEPKALDTEDLVHKAAAPSTDKTEAGVATSSAMSNASNAECLREGDWICASCKKVNFGWRQGYRCFDCKYRKPKVNRKDDKEDAKKKKEETQHPLLLQPGGPILDTLFDYFDIQRDSFPLDNTRLIRRKKGEVTDIVVVSDALSKLAISDKWAPVREIGISIASFSNEGGNLKLFDEGLHITAKHATKRHITLSPATFLNALAQSVMQLLKSSSTAEVGRVRATLDRSSVHVDSLCENDMWYDTLDDQMMVSMWKACQEMPGYFIVSCEFNMTSACLPFCASIDSKGSVTVQTSLRIVAASLVVVHKYTQITASSNSATTKRRRTNEK